MDAENNAAVESTETQAPASAPEAQQAAPAQSDTILGGAEGTAPEQQNTVPESYDFSNVVPDGMTYDAEQAAAFGAVAKECGLSQEQASKLAAYGMQYGLDGIARAEAAYAEKVAGWGQAAKSELGADFEKTTAMAARGIRAVEARVPGIKDMLNETGAGNRVEMIKLLAELGQLTGEDSGHTGGTAGAAANIIYDKTNFAKYI